MKARYPDRIGRYEVIDRLGVGGMGAVYLASDPLLGRTVAVKILHTDDDELRQRFEREARSAASLRHQHIVTIYDIGDDEGGPFLAMEFLDGETMAEVIRRRSPLPIDVRLDLMSQLCSGLGYAHRKGIIHRDIKPANLMITSEGVLKIVDFGLARVTSGAGMTRSGMLMGTPHYMSPEQVHGTGVDHLSDIFSVGVVLYELISYRKAYQGDSTAAILHNILHGQPAPITASLGELDPELEVVVSRAIEKPKERRYQDLRELGADLERVRSRLKAVSEGATVVVDRSAMDLDSRSKPPEAEDTGAPPLVKPAPSESARSSSPPRRNLDAIAQKRTAQIAQHLAAASEHLDAGRPDEAVEQCEHVLLLDPHDRRALQLLEKAHEAIDERQVNRWVDEARAEMSHGAFTRADELVEQALKVRAQSTSARTLQQQIREKRLERERAADRARAVKNALERARHHMQEGAFDAAARAASEALGYDSAHEEAKALRQEAIAALEERRREEALIKAAQDAAARGREAAAAGNYVEALAALRAFVPPHPFVNEAIAEIDARVRALEQERREEEERARQRALAEARRQEQLATLRQVTQTAIVRGDWPASHAAVRAAREALAGDEEVERLCRAIETETHAAEAAARLHAEAQRHLGDAEGALARGDLTAAAKSADAAVSLTPEDSAVLRLQQAVQEQLARAEEARQQQLREQIERERLEQERVEAERLAREREEHERAERERAERERIERERVERERAERERVERERVAREQAERERVERERVEREHAERERVERERLERERVEQERVERERVAREQAEQERQEQERLKHERLERERGEAAARLARERDERARVKRERAERERVERERVKHERIERERAKHERLARERVERERIEAERREQERLERERQEQERLEHERQEQERLEHERQEQERLEYERQEQERLEHERQEQERLEHERVEAARLARERVEVERVERERVEAERREQERLLQEQQNQQRLEQERLESARLARERPEQASPDSEDGPAETWLTVLRSERRERQRQQEELRKREQERERLEQQRAEEKRRDQEVHSALARDRQLAAEARARAEALRLSAEAEALRLRAEAEALRLRAEAERAALELPIADVEVEQPDAPPSTTGTPSADDLQPIDDAAAAAWDGDVTQIQSDVTVSPAVRVSGAASRWPLRIVAVVVAAAVVIAAVVWWRSTTSEVRPPPPPDQRVDHSATLRQAVSEYQRGEVAAAITTALSIPESAAERQQALELLQTIRLDAAARAQTARLGAEAAGKTGEAAFVEAAAKQQEAERATSPTDTQRALSLLADATRLYQQAAASGPSAPQLLQDARRELQANRIPRAIDYALQVLTIAPADEDALALLRSIRTQAERQARAAADAARRAGASADNSSAYREGVALENTGRAATDVKDTQRAHDAFSKARERYSAAIAQVRGATERDLQRFRAEIARAETRLKANDLTGAAAALEEAERLNPSDPAIASLRKRLTDLRAGAAATTQRETQIRQILDAAAREPNDNTAMTALQSGLTQFPGEARLESAFNGRRRARDLRIIDLIRRARAAQGTEAVQLLEQALALDPTRSDVRAERDSRKAGGVNRRDLERDVRQTIERFKDAYQNRDVNDVLRVAPNVSRSTLEGHFKPFSRMRVDMEPCSVALTPDGTGANVTCAVKRTGQPAGISARAVTDSRTWQFQLSNANGTWLITAAQF